jgi:hypothetical protein
MRLRLSNPRQAFLLVLMLAALGLSGCASTEPENMSERPWNSPRPGDYGGIPGMSGSR